MGDYCLLFLLRCAEITSVHHTTTLAMLKRCCFHIVNSVFIRLRFLVLRVFVRLRITNNKIIRHSRPTQSTHGSKPLYNGRRKDDEIRKNISNEYKRKPLGCIWAVVVGSGVFYSVDKKLHLDLGCAYLPVDAIPVEVFTFNEFISSRCTNEFPSNAPETRLISNDDG